MAGTGGARPGSGRKPKADKYSGAINRAERKIIDRLPEILDAQIELSLGVKATRFNQEKQQEEVYTTIPDRAAGQYLINRILGSPIQKQELQGKDGNDLVIKVVYDNANSDTDPTETP